MSLLNSNVRKLAVITLNCPHCGVPRDFTVVFTNLSVGIKGISLLPIKRHYAAICKDCQKLYYLNKEKGDMLLAGCSVTITSSDLSAEREENC